MVMYILIANDCKDLRLELKLKLHKTYPDAVIYEANSLYEVFTDVFDVTYDLLILDLNMPGNDQLENFVGKAVKYTKIIILSVYSNNNKRINELIALGADAFLKTSANEEEIASVLSFLFSRTHN